MTRLGSLVALAFVVPLALLLAVGGAAASSLRAFEAADREVEASREVVQALDQLLSALKDVETGGRGFILAGDERFLEPLLAAGPVLRATRAQLRQRRPGEELRALEAAVDARLELTEAAVAHRRLIGLEAAAAEVRAREGLLLMDEVRRRVAALEAAERARLGPLREEARRAASRARDVVVWGTAGAFLAAFIAGALVVRHVTRSRSALVRGAEAVGSGDLTARVDLPTRDELGDLAAAFNDMAGRLAAARAAEVEARTRLEATARELRQQTAILDRFFSMTSDLLYIGDRSATATRLNPAWERTLGFTADEMRAAPMLSFVHPDDLERTTEVSKNIRKGIPLVDFETRYRTKAGGWRWLEWTASWDPALEISCGVARDVTERRERDDQLQRQSEELRAQAEELRAQGEELRAQRAELEAHQRELELKNAELERASRLKSEFLANMSHELRTPLNAVIGFSELLLDEARAALGPVNARYVEDIHASGRHLLTIINELLDLARIEAGKLDLRAEPLDAAAAAAEAASLVEAAARAKEILVVTSGAAPPVLADRGRLRQVLLNLLSNAVKFSPRGARVEVRVEPAGAAVRLSVRDTGPGMAPELVARLFQPFVQGEGPLSKRHEGTGLGLAITKRLVEAHGGTVTVRSAPGEGSTFEVTLPAAAAAADRPEGGPDVLVVADPARAAVLARWLAEAGLAPLEAAPADAVAVAERLLPAAIVIEMTFDPDDGARLLSRLRAVDALRATPALLATVGEAGPGLVGSLDAFVKPLATSAGRDELVARVARLVGPRPERPPRILLIDDDPSVGAVLGPVLEAAGHRVTVVATGEAGLDEARRDPPALAIVDLALPDLSGFEVIERLSADERTRAVPVVVLTALDLSDAQRARLRAGGRAVAEKGTFTREELLATVRRALAGPAAAAAAGPTILVVDDHDLNRELARSFLARRGYRVLCAAGGEEALALVRRDRPALVLMDLAMPGKDGFATAASLKADAATRDIPVVALTALAMRADEERARAAGFADYLTKPIERQVLEEAVARLLRPHGPLTPRH